METKQILDCNKMIAEFMGVMPIKGWCDGYALNKAGLPFNYGAMGNGTSDLKFHSSWDWLMPVVEKIEGLDDNEGEFDCHFEILRDGCLVIAWHGETIIEIYGNTKIESVWLAVVEFIKWRNEQVK